MNTNILMPEFLIFGNKHEFVTSHIVRQFMMFWTPRKSGGEKTGRMIRGITLRNSYRHRQRRTGFGERANEEQGDQNLAKLISEL